LSLEEESSGKLKKTLDEVREVINKEFKDEEDRYAGCAERSTRLQKISEDILNMLKSRQDETSRWSDLVVLSSIVFMQSQIQSELAIANVRRTRDLKDVIFSLFKIPLTIMVKILSPIVDAIPKAMTKERNAVKEELEKLNQQIEQLEKRKEEITIEIPENFEETFRWLERKMKAETRGEEEAKKMSR
jgi:flagellar capping protein FliD